jgi:hypothetical protein
MNNETQAAVPQAAPQTTAKPKKNRRLLWLMLLLLVGAAAVSFVVFRFIVPKFTGVPRELVGTWQVMEGDFKGATFECRWTGTAIFARHIQGKTETDESSIRVRGKRFFLTHKNNLTGKEETLVQTILLLTDDELVFRDEVQRVYKMIRIRD